VNVHLGVADFRSARKAHSTLLGDSLSARVQGLPAAGFDVVEDDPLDGKERVDTDETVGNLHGRAQPARLVRDSG